ncbi:hypothetical protein DFAR_3710005 [Desulfarculales bacterium]
MTLAPGNFSPMAARKAGATCRRPPRAPEPGARHAQSIGAVPLSGDSSALAHDMENLLERAHSVPFGQIDTSALILDLMHVHPFRMQAPQYALARQGLPRCGGRA